MLKQGLMLAAATLALAACNSRSTDQAATDASAAGANAMAGASEAMDGAATSLSNAATDMAPAGATAATTAEFVQKMAISDMYEIESSKLALTKASAPEIKAFAKQMIADHTATTAKVKAIAAKDPALAVPAAMDAEHQKLIANLKAATPDTFDTLYADQQTDGHETAHALLTSYASSGDNSALKAFAAETAPKVQGHLDMIRKLDKSGADDAPAGARN